MDSYIETIAFKCDAPLRARMEAAAEILGQSLSTLARTACTLAYMPPTEDAPAPEPEDLDFPAMRARRKKILAEIDALDAVIEDRYAALMNRAGEVLALQATADQEKLEIIAKMLRREVPA